MSNKAVSLSLYVRQLDQGWSPKCEAFASKSPGDWAVLKTTAVQPIHFHESENKQLPNHLAPRPEIEVTVGDVLITRAGPRSRVGIACVVRKTRPRLMLADKIYRLKLREELADPVWVALMLNAPQTLELIEAMKTGMSDSGLNLTQEKFLSLSVPYQSLEAQRRIVAKIDSLSSKSKRARNHVDHIPRLVEKYKEAILAAAFRGDLSRDWRATSRIGDTRAQWKKCTLSEICAPQRLITYGVIKLGSEVANGVPCLRTSNVRWLNIDIDGVKKIAPTLSAQYDRTVLQGGEVLVNVRGTLGGVAVATPNMAGWNVSREVAVVPVDAAHANPHYVAYWIGAEESQRWLDRVEKGVAYTGINLQDLRNLPIELPAIDEQMEIIRLINSSWEEVTHLATEAASARKLIDHLDQAVLAKAFRGELVSQDPNDEPASVILERIRAERSSMSRHLDKRTRRPLRTGWPTSR